MATTRFRHRRLLPVVAIGASILTGGCAVNRTSMSMDSVSRRPFFGIELAPKKRSTPVYEKSIAQHRRQAADAPKVQPAIRETKTDGPWPEWLALPSSRPTLPLPRTDLAVGTAGTTHTASSETTQPIEF